MKKSSRKTSTSNRRSRSSVESVLAYFDLRRKNFLRALSAAQSYYAVEGIHELRVETKRLRALYELVEYTAPVFSAQPHALTLRTLFRAAGELRDLDIRQDLTLRSLKKLDLREFFNQLKQDELRARDSFDAVAGSFSGDALTRSRVQMRAALAAAPGERMRKRIEKKIGKMAAKLATAVNRDRREIGELHSIRKIAKELRYVLDIHQQCYGKSQVIEQTSIRLKRAFGYLGEWHDTVLTLDSVEVYLKRKPAKDLSDPIAYQTFIAELRKRSLSRLAAYARGRMPLQRALGRLSRQMSSE
jgi:CHAD domain-containing protein